MQDTPHLRSLTDGAERAAAQGDYTTAERLLRSAAIAQESERGPLAPDLANTLNNLGVVCEILDKPADAEQCYRRACEIATALFPPDHPFVLTSRKNLDDFRTSHAQNPDRVVASNSAGSERVPEAASPVVVPPIPVPEVVPSAPGERSREELRRTASPHSPASSTRTPAPVSPESKKSARSFVVAASVVFAVVLIVFLTMRFWNRPTERLDESAPNSTVASVPESPAPAAAPISPVSEPKDPGATPVPPAPRGEEPRPTSSAATAVLASAQLCQALSTGGASGDWNCTPAEEPVRPGQVSFYTRLKSPADTTVVHRWYRGDRLYQAVDLPIRANQGSGYRTFSRYSMTAESSGDWRVELRAEDGSLLYEKRFIVR